MISKIINKIRFNVVKLVVWLLMPKDVFVGIHYGAYTCKWQVTFGMMDSRGVLQGYDITHYTERGL